MIPYIGALCNYLRCFFILGTGFGGGDHTLLSLVNSDGKIKDDARWSCDRVLATQFAFHQQLERPHPLAATIMLPYAAVELLINATAARHRVDEWLIKVMAWRQWSAACQLTARAPMTETCCRRLFTARTWRSWIRCQAQTAHQPMIVWGATTV